MSQVPTPVVPGALGDPEAGLPYPLALRRVGFQPVQCVVGLLAVFAVFAVVVPFVNQAVLWVAFTVSGGGDWGAYRASAGAYELPMGPAASNLALAMLIPVSLLLVRCVHKIRLRWVWSVQPGVRWRYGVIAVALAAVVLNAALWLGFLAREVPRFHSGQPGWEWFVIAVVVTSPLQAAAEEVLFRGYLLQAIGSATGRAWVGVAGSAVVFAVLHGPQNPALFAHRLAFGLIAGALVIATGGLEAAIAAHVVNNLGAYGYALFTSSLMQLRAVTEISWADAAFDIGGFAAFAVLAWLLSRRLALATTS